MKGKSKSILLQVAFKGAIEVGKPTEEQTVSFYEMLVALHERLGIDADEGAAPARSGFTKRTGTTNSQPIGETFILDGELYTDFRAAKAAPGSALKANYPDFKRESDNQGFWLYTRDGEPNEEVAPLVAASDTRVM